MTITARNIGRINVWPTYDIAREADTEESKFVGQLTVWRTADEARANISHEEEGGDRPDWVPADAVIHIDLVNDRAWTLADGEVTVDTLLGADPNTDNVETTGYDPETLTEDGLPYAVPPALIGSARSMLLAGATMRVRSMRGSEDQSKAVTLCSADGNDAIIFIAHSGQGSYVNSYSGDLFVQTAGIVTNNGLEDAINVLAFTYSGTRAEFAVNGIDALSGEIMEADRPSVTT